jgi:hypothetical protein
MYEEIALLEIAIWFGLPAWIANSTPVLFGGGSPIDRDMVFRDGHRLLTAADRLPWFSHWWGIGWGLS